MRQNQTILHVDDRPSFLRLVARHLQTVDYEVISLPDPLQTQAMLLETDARLVLLDIDMPQKDGLTVLREIKQQDGGIQVIMLTSLVATGTVLQSMRWGAEACVFKPILDFNTLTTAVEASSVKVTRWWECLQELNERKATENLESVASLPE